MPTARARRPRSPLLALGLALTLLPTVPARDAAWAGPDRRPPAPPGVRWEESVEGALARSAREGRPLLVCVNALEDERANVQLATGDYRSEAWGRATRPYVCLVANPNGHAAAGGACARYGHAPCATHQAALAWVIRRFAPDGALISPQHLILEPDGDVAYRKEYFTGEERPALFEGWLARLTPGLAQRIAAIDREARITELGRLPATKVGDAARAWLAAPEDGLAASGLLVALDEAAEPPRRLALIAALARCPYALVPALVPAAEAVTYAPDERPEEALAWVGALLEADRPTGVWAAARVLVRARDPGLRSRLLTLWSARPDDAGESAAREEALRLAGLPVPSGARVPDAEGLERVALLRRERARRRGATGGGPLPGDLAARPPGEQRRLLLGAAPESVEARGPEVEHLLLATPHARVRTAAALALLAARRPAGGATAATVLAAVLDVLEGPEARALAAQRLGEDYGEDGEAWAAALAAHLGAVK